MKADEYATQIIDSDDLLTAASEAVRSITLEFQDICKARKAKTDNAAKAINAELEQKWKAVCRRVNKKLGPVLSDDGFRLHMAQHLPDVFVVLYSKNEWLIAMEKIGSLQKQDAHERILEVSK